MMQDKVETILNFEENYDTDTELLLDTIELLGNSTYNNKKVVAMLTQTKKGFMVYIFNDNKVIDKLSIYEAYLKLNK